MSKVLKTLPLDEATRLVVASSTVSYIGKALVGSLTSAAVWKCSRLTTTTGGNITIEYAASGNYTNVWDDHLILTYV